MLEQGGVYDIYFLLIEFTYDDSFNSSLGMTLFETLYGRRCMTPLCLYGSGESVMLGPGIVQQTYEKIKMIREKSYHEESQEELP